MSSVLTTVFVPPYIDIDVFRQRLREESIIIYEGKGPLKGRVFQIGNIGELSDMDVVCFLGVLRETLNGLRAVDLADTTILPHDVLNPRMLPALPHGPITVSGEVSNTNGGLVDTAVGEHLKVMSNGLDSLVGETTESI
jgi:2-aminoethylphosphonate-pyruvate transaminase